MTSVPSPRQHDLDALRAFAMLLGIALHAALSFVEFPWVVQDQSQHAGYGLFFYAVHGFRMPLFFLLSGFFTAMLWRRRGLGGLVGQRVRRILLPLLLSCATIIPLMWGAVIWAGSRPAAYATESTSTTGAPRQDVWTLAAYGDIEGLTGLVESGVELDAEDPTFGQTPLGWAAITGQGDAAGYLLEAGADANMRYRDRNTALHTAAFFGRAEIASLLLEAGADVHARNIHGESPMDSMRHDRGTTEFIAALLKMPIDFDTVAAGRERIASMLEGRGGEAFLADRTDNTAGEKAGGVHAGAVGEGGGNAWAALNKLLLGLMLIPLFHHLWFLWFLCWMVAGFVLLVGLLRRLPLPGLPAWLVRSPVCWLWIIPLTMVPQAMMHTGGSIPGFGPDTSIGLVPLPHVLLMYGIYFGFGALYYETGDSEGRLGRAWWMHLPLALVVVLPLGLGFSLHLPWAAEFTDAGTRRMLSVFLEVLYTWLMVFGLIGLCRRLLSRERAWIRYLSDASYWLYLAHLPLIIVGQALVQHWPLPAFVKFAFLLGGVTGVLLVVYQYGVRYTWLGRLLNGPRTRPGPVESRATLSDWQKAASPGAGGR